MRRDPSTAETRTGPRRNGARSPGAPSVDPTLGNAASPTSVLVLVGLFLLVFVIGIVTVLVPELHEERGESGPDASVEPSP